MKSYVLGSSVLVSYLSNDTPAKAATAADLFGAADRGEVILHVDSVAIAQALQTLFQSYRPSRKAIIARLLALLEIPGVRVEFKETLVRALEMYVSYGLSFGEAWLLSRSALLQVPTFAFEPVPQFYQQVGDGPGERITGTGEA